MAKVPRKKHATSKTDDKPDQVVRATEPPKSKSWAMLIYMCGDNDLEPYIDADFAEICKIGSTPDMHVVVQIDRRDGARRYVLPEGGSSNSIAPDPSLKDVRVNTGEPAEAIRFLRWAVKQAPADHLAVIFSGLGIDRGYVERRMLQDDLEASEDVDVEPSGDETLDFEQSPAQARIAKLRALRRQRRVEKQLLSICHDQTSNDSLEASQLRGILTDLKKEGHRVELFGLDVGAAALVEIAYELDGLADVFVASQSLMPDDGWPYDKILTAWQKRIERASRRSPADAASLGQLIVDQVSAAYRRQKPAIAAINLSAEVLERTARVLDTLAQALMYNLGDWHVLEAMRVANFTALQAEQQRRGQAGGEGSLPTVDMLEMLEQFDLALQGQLPDTPVEFGQRERIVELLRLVNNARQELRRSEESDSDQQPLLLASEPDSNRGISILMPNVRPPAEVDLSEGRPASFNYFELLFSKRVHWASLVGTFQLIMEKPHVLWRLISSMLLTARSEARGELLQRLIGPNSLMAGLKQEMQVFAADTAISLSLEETPDDDAECDMFKLRLESASGGATVAEHHSRVYNATMNAALSGLEELLNSNEPLPVMRPLETLGRTLGEDLIQKLATRLSDEHDAMQSQTAGVPHLRLQIPRNLMRYPWELMYDRHAMLCERFALGRQVFMEAQLTRQTPNRKAGPIRVLVIGDPEFSDKFPGHPRQLPCARAEAATVVETLNRLRDELAGMPRIEVDESIGQSLSVLEMRDLLRGGRYDIIHFAGHATFDPKIPESSAWLLSDGKLRAREIANTMSWSDSPPWLVFANACEAGMDGASQATYQGNVFGLATAFINEGVAGYIGPLWPVDDFVAANLAVHFYETLLLKRASLGTALWKAKREMREYLLGNSEQAAELELPASQALSWASVVLYGDPTARALDSLWTPHGQEGATPSTRPPAKPSRQADSRASAFEATVESAAAGGSRGTKSKRARVYPVWFGTNRQPVDINKPSLGFSGERDSRIHYGICNVSIPESHKFGEVGSSWWKRWLFFYDDRLKLIDTATLPAASFWTSIKAALLRADVDARDALVYLHGFNVTFEEAAIRAAQIGFDLNFPGVMAFYSWPSRGNVEDYTRDEATIEASEQFISQFLIDFAQFSGVRKLHVLAHSMGNRGLLRSIERIVGRARGASSIPFGQIMLAAPDIDNDLFRDLATRFAELRPVADRTTLYVSSKDLALASSGIVHDHPRAGFVPPPTVVAGINTIEVTNIDLTLLGHGYFASAEPVLYDIRELVLHNVDPDRRARLERVATPPDVYWRVKS